MPNLQSNESNPSLSILSLSFLDSLKHPQSRLPITSQVLLQAFLPLILLYHLTALLVTIKNTFAVRLALLPLTLRLAWSLGTTYAVLDPYLNHLNYAFIIVLLVIAMRTVEWTCRIEPYRRKRQDTLNSLPILYPIRDAFDLSFNSRGLGWCWGKSCPSLVHSPITYSFLLDSFIRLLTSFTIFDVVFAAIQSTDSPSTRTIYDYKLSIPLRYAKSTALAFCTGVCIYTAINAMYRLFTVLGVLLLRHTPEDWPKLFNSPFSAVSLADFWGKRWHQLFRRNFVFIGGKPLHFLFGKLGGAMGVFLISALLHDWGMWGMGQGTEFHSVGGYFLIQSVGVILEGALQSLQGQSISGWTGSIWTFLWVVLPCNIMVEAWFQRGLAECVLVPNVIRPTSWLQTLLNISV